MPSLSENEESASVVDIKELAQTSKMTPKYERMKQRIKILRQEIKTAEMRSEIIKYEINHRTSKAFANLKRNPKLVYKSKISSLK